MLARRMMNAVNAAVFADETFGRHRRTCRQYVA
jgi:hypothetical protein